MKALFDKVSQRTSKMVTTSYSTSFSLGIFFLDRTLHQHIYAIYGFVRFADEVVDTFHEHDKKWLLDNFREQTYDAIERGISLNPVLNSFQATVNEFNIDRNLIDTFLKSMEMDINPREYDSRSYDEYILGSAEVVGLMCLKVFCYGDQKQYEALSPEAMKLGSAFQKINFLRDLNADYYHLGRIYFPGVEIDEFNDTVKSEIEADIEKDFRKGYEGILKLPKKARFGVYIAYVYYYALFQKIKATPAQVILQKRVRIPNSNKYGLLLSSYFRHSFNLL
ncbi:MAG TPA: phytoene synthase [Cryomorphaceae bacterium]|nr:phytoene synthase [Owenweeksia sp.]MBF97908.1 phytoene synthase [Owenweeksia sp.]HAD97231.1 phytoene synthase [Cryomorphaceae bacterium]HBF20052.1 phytoene synthase [Cryomorphaceae bacterium]HCQ14732.1 phytoene synthase [Cryomorphaceae bacterium]|tara:strand:+ start:270 stop:1106 length:837 start_codon:yes stop_codon:yes gene_type:complete